MEETERDEGASESGRRKKNEERHFYNLVTLVPF